VIKLANPRNLKNIRQVKKINFSNPISIGGSNRGSVFVGRIHFKDNTKSRAAIKVFHSKLTKEKAKQYQKLIDDLIKAGVPLPKTGMALVPKGTMIGDHKIATREWVQVSQLFGATKKGSKLVWKSHLELRTMQEKEEAAKIFGKVARLGYNPTTDFIEPFRYKQGVVPMDLDLLVERHKEPPQQKMTTLSTTIRRISPTKEEFRRLSTIALKQLKLEQRKLAREKFQERIKNWEKEKYISKSVKLN
jgi:hypothetical protein